ncbi:MAG: hypothetical protein ACTJGD_00515 [Mesonia hippocampi]|uniref:hypothetical protein n=1 Tax=Mesonia hippocampi TaxID=1628250 RepID=UPI003F944783
MKKLIIILFFLILATLLSGFYVQWNEENEKLAHLLIGLAVFSGSFILMPIFLYYSWKGKRLKDYTLTKENLEKVRNRK